MIALAAAVSTAACTSEPAADVDPQAFRDAVNAICTTSQAEQDALAVPDAPNAVAPFALDVAGVLESEAELLRAVTPPSSLAADHRAFIQNTDDQARRWRELAATPPENAADFGAIQTGILELGLGRNDLAAEMQLPSCRRGTG